MNSEQNFAHLHVHTQYSLLDGACRLDDLLDRALALGQRSIAITDHGVMYGVQEFYKKALERGIKPVIGCEMYVAPRTRFDKSKDLDSERYHLILLCKNMTGYHNLIKLVSLSWTEGFYTKPRIDRELISKYSDGLIALSGCMFGEVQRAILNGDTQLAESTAQWYNATFGEGNYYLEIQDHLTAEDRVIKDGLIRLSRKLGIPLAATNDVHYVRREDSETQRVLVCIATNRTLEEGSGLDFSTEEFYLKSRSEMDALFSDFDDACENTLRIADKCSLEFEYGVTKLPSFDVPGNSNHAEYLKQKCIDGLTGLFPGGIPENYTQRLMYELSVIDTMGFSDYFLIVSDFIDYARSHGIPVGPGRGSAAGSLAAFSIGITELDPIEYGLLFERFLNPERVSMPDIDIDFCYERRTEVIDYVIEKYGADHVAQIVTFGTMAARAAVRDAARVMGIPYSVSDGIAKAIPREMNITIDSALKKSEEIRTRYENDADTKKLIDIARSIEGMPRHASTHAAGVVITKEPVYEYVPLAKNDDSTVTQYTMTEIEQLGLLKMDFLGLRTLTVISDAEKLVKKLTPDFDVSKIPLDDKEVYSEMSKGNTLGIFQCESRGMTELIMNLKPVCFNDIAAAIALYRPGPMFFIDSYIQNRKNPTLIKYRSPLLKDIFDETCGCPVYQEQVMRVFRTLAGYSYGRADVVRRAMSKKKHDVMEREREIFINGLTDQNGAILVPGAVRLGTDAKTADAVFGDLVSFASYGFNKSHTAAYGLVAYRTAYLKVKYPKEFMAALLTSVLDDSGKVSLYISECSRLGITVGAPHVNKSSLSFTTEESGIRFGLLAIKNLGRNFINRIISERDTAGGFTSFEEFCRRVYGTDFNRRAIESLIKAGALDSLGSNRREMLQGLPLILDSLESEKHGVLDGQMDFFSLNAPGDTHSVSALKLPSAQELPKKEMLMFEKEVTGLYISGHPLSEYTSIAKKYKCINIADLTADDPAGIKREGEYTLLGIITRLRKKVTKKDDIMAFATLEDLSGSLEMLVFPKLLARYAQVLAEDGIFIVKGRLSDKDEDEPKFIPDSFQVVSELLGREQSMPASDAASRNDSPNKKKRSGLFIKLNSSDEDKKNKALNIISIFEGNLPAYFYYEDKKEYHYLGSELHTSPNEPMIAELRRIAGENNIALIQ